MTQPTSSPAHLSVHLPLGGGLKAWIVERPGLHLDDTARARLLGDLRAIAGKTLDGDDLDYGVFDETSGALERTLVTLLYNRKTGDPVAFNSLPILDMSIRGETRSVLHLGLVMVDPDARQGGLSAVLYGLACAILLIRNQFRPIWISSVTQVPAVVGLVSEMYSDVYPSPLPRSRRSFEHLLMARRIMAEHRAAFGVGPDADFDEQSFVIANAYTGGSDHLKKRFEDAPKHRKDVFNTMCDTQLDYDRGDDFLQIGRLDVEALRHYCTRIAPQGLGLAPVLGLFFFGFQSLFLPVLHWFNDKRAWGGLRPARAHTERPVDHG